MNRRFGETPRPGIRYRIRPGAYCIVQSGDLVLLTHQKRPVPEFQLPGGGIDPGESAIQALHREVLEETGWLVASPRKIAIYRRFTYMPEYDLWAEKIAHVYLARPVRVLHEPLEDGHTALWVPVDEAIELLESDGDRYVLSRRAASAIHPAH